MGFNMDDRRAPYLQVTDALRAAIRDGTYAPGDRLPPVVELANAYGVAKMTVQRAIAVLREEGLIVSWQGRGTYVRARPSDESDDTRSEYDEIMHRLDSMYDEIQRLEERLARLELRPPTTPTTPTTPPSPADRWRVPGHHAHAGNNGRSRSSVLRVDGRPLFREHDAGPGDARGGTVQGETA